MGIEALVQTVNGMKNKGDVHAAIMVDAVHCTCNGHTYPTNSTIPAHLYTGKKVYVVILDNKAIVVGD